MLNSNKRFSGYAKINNLKSDAGDWLPSDNELLARTKKWSNFFSKYNVEEDESLAVDLRNDECLEELLNSDAESSESVASTDFVDAEAKEDPNFDVKEALNQTMKAIEKRKKNWGRSGFDKLMESSFRMDKYSSKVASWLDRNSRYLPEDYKFRMGRGPSCPDAVVIRDHRVYIDRPSSSDSDASVDTVKYILSNKKKPKTRCRTMTIKEYCYSQRRNKEREQCCRKISPRSEHYLDLKLNHRNHPYSESVRQKFKRRHKSKCTRTVFESDSSSSSDCKSEGAGRFRRSKQPKRSCYKESSASRETSRSKHYSEMQISEINFVPENIMNSTQISNKLPDSGPRSNLQPIPEQNETTMQSSSSEPKKKLPTSNPIVIYTPQDASKNFESNITNGKILLTRKMLEDSIGLKLAKIYLKLDKNFSYEFDQQSKVLFYPPEEIDETTDTDADILEYMSWNTRGRIVEILNSK